jgi:hypothetical protein
MVNNITSRITKFRASEAIGQPDKVLADRYNDRRQAPGKRLAKRVRVGDLVRYLLKARKADKFFKSYKKNYSGVHKVTQIQGNSYLLSNGKRLPRNRIVPVAEVDKASLALIEDRGAKKELTLEQKKAKAETRAKARQLEREHYKAKPRRSTRADTQKVHLKK